MILTKGQTRLPPQAAMFSWATWENLVRIRTTIMVWYGLTSRQNEGDFWPWILASHRRHGAPSSSSIFIQNLQLHLILIIILNINHSTTLPIFPKTSLTSPPPGNHRRRVRNDPRPDKGRDHHKRGEEHSSVPDWGSHQIRTGRFRLKLCCGGFDDRSLQRMWVGDNDGGVPGGGQAEAPGLPSHGQGSPGSFGEHSNHHCRLVTFS